MLNRERHNFIFQTITLAGLIFCSAAIQVDAQTVVVKLRSGDRISGNIVSETTNQIVISNAWAKSISIPLAEIQSREILPPPVAATNPIVVAKTTPAPATPVVVSPPKPAIKPKGPKDWHGDVQVGADVGISEKNRQLYYAKFKITYAPVRDAGPMGTSRLIDRFRNTFDYNAAYGTTDGILSANRMDGSSKTDFDLGTSRRVFVYNLFGAGYDEIRKIERRYEIGPGVGYHLFTRTNFILNAEIGLNYQAQYLQNREKTERVYYRLAEDLTWKISKSLTFDEKFEFFPQVNFDEYRMRFESNLRYWLLENISFNLTVVDTYDTQVAPNVDRNDLQIRSSIGVKF
ncbi:MAG: DUF481 domain-containing protein [Verrucomicrobiota bacterium]